MLGTPPIKTIKKTDKTIKKKQSATRNIDKLTESHLIFCRNYLVLLSNFKTNNMKQIKVIKKVERYFENFIKLCNTNQNITNDKFKEINFKINELKQHILPK
jgi:hypothetical protein